MFSSDKVLVNYKNAITTSRLYDESYTSTKPKSNKSFLMTANRINVLVLLSIARI
jgi:hypothetical protein